MQETSIEPKGIPEAKDCDVHDPREDHERCFVCSFEDDARMIGLLCQKALKLIDGEEETELEIEQVAMNFYRILHEFGSKPIHWL